MYPEVKECIRQFPHICKVNGPCNGWPKEKTMNYLSPEVNAAIAKSEEDGGVFLSDLEVGARLFVQTKNILYEIEKRTADGFYISGHPKYCPEPVYCYIAGSTFGGSMIKFGFIGVGMHLEFSLEGRYLPITTFRIQSIGELS